MQGFASNVYRDLYTDIWSAGLKYETGPWAVSASYVYADEELFFGSQQGTGMQVAAAYTIDENFRVSGGFQHFAFDGPFGGCPTDAGGFGCYSLDGDVGYLETTFSF